MPLASWNRKKGIFLVALTRLPGARISSQKYKLKKNVDSVTLPAWMLLCVLHRQWMQRHTYPTWRVKLREAIQWGSGGWEASLGTSVLMIYQNALRKWKCPWRPHIYWHPSHPSSIFWPARMADYPPVHLPKTLNTWQSLPALERLSIFSDLSAVKAHMHITHKPVTPLVMTSHRPIGQTDWLKPPRCRSQSKSSTQKEVVT